MKRVTPVLFMDTIEPALPFWEALGFQKTAEVPHGDALGFVILQNGDIEVMLQTRASIQDDMPKASDFPGLAALFLEVSSLEEITPALAHVESVLESQRKTFYGAIETIVKAPGGHIVNLAFFPKEDGAQGT